MKYGIISDIHLDEWSVFSTINEAGINSRLQILCDAMLEADAAMHAAGCEAVFIAGDLFHTRGNIAPVVANMARETLKKFKVEKVYILSGNHDETKEDSDSLYSAIPLVDFSSNIFPIVDKPALTVMGDNGTKAVVCFPWRATSELLLEDMKRVKRHYPDLAIDAIIHVGVADVISGLDGLSGKQLSDLGYRYVWAGHYHNHKEVYSGVYSIGALTHQTWSDVDTKAGYVIVDGDNVTQQETIAPKFVDFREEMAVSGDGVAGNYIRVRSSFESKDDVAEIKEWLKDFEAAGVQIHPIAKKNTTRVEDDLELDSEDTEEAVKEWVDWKFGEDPDKAEVADMCSQYLDRGES